MRIRPATKSDAPHMCTLIDMAGNGMAGTLWLEAVAPGRSILEHGRSRAIRDEGDFSWRNTHILEDDGEVAGMLMGFRVDDPYRKADTIKLHPVVRPLVELEALAAGTWYLNALAIYEEHRRKGLGRVLLEKADELARAAGARRVSLIVISANDRALAFYERAGFVERARRPFVPFSDWGKGGDLILMFKDLDR